ncbi:MAG TPA: helix-turn-helix transcriptional regulator [Candidatus Saccharimonadales bacterium]|nr:helix-turn-helix transcriptional regulator [Candidatus Saccharimonadales bacterium]
MSGSEDDYLSYVKQLQAQAMEELQSDMERFDRLRDPVRRERELFRMQLSRARYRKGLSQSELAARTGIRQSDISRIENGKANPGLTVLLRIAKALDANLVVE